MRKKVSSRQGALRESSALGSERAIGRPPAGFKSETLVLNDCDNFIEQIKAKIVEMDYMEEEFDEDE